MGESSSPTPKIVQPKFYSHYSKSFVPTFIIKKIKKFFKFFYKVKMTKMLKKLKKMNFYIIINQNRTKDEIIEK